LAASTGLALLRLFDKRRVYDAVSLGVNLGDVDVITAGDRLGRVGPNRE
jgi:hypothetical protein